MSKQSKAKHCTKLWSKGKASCVKVFCNKLCEYFGYEEFFKQTKNSFCLNFVPFLFSIIKITFIVHLFSIVYDALVIKRHITLTLQNHSIKNYKNSKTVSLVTINALSLLIPAFLEEIMLLSHPQHLANKSIFLVLMIYLLTQTVKLSFFRSWDMMYQEGEWLHFTSWRVTARY